MDRSKETVGARLRREMMLLESVSSVALSHPDNCDCRICRAAGGDEDALKELGDLLPWDP